MSADTESLAHEETFVSVFVAKDYRNRLLFELHQRRNHFLGRFCHRALEYLDSRFVIPLPTPNSDPAKILQLLQKRGAGTACHAMSMSADIDARTLPLAEALTIAVGYGMPSILSCCAGQLAYLETEQEFGPPDRFILFRPPSSRTNAQLLSDEHS